MIQLSKFKSFNFCDLFVKTYFAINLKKNANYLDPFVFIIIFYHVRDEAEIENILFEKG